MLNTKNKNHKDFSIKRQNEGFHMNLNDNLSAQRGKLNSVTPVNKYENDKANLSVSS